MVNLQPGITLEPLPAKGVNLSLEEPTITWELLVTVRTMVSVSSTKRTEHPVKVVD